MNALRPLLRRYRLLALLLVALALAARALVPAGFMISASPARTLAVLVCTDASGGAAQLHQLTVPGKVQTAPDPAKGTCAFAALGHAALGGAGPILLAAALAFILLLGVGPVTALPRRATVRLRPPLRAPPLPA